jgi:hypothetical protein
MKRIISTTKVSVATAVVAVALLASCGGDDSGEATSASAAERVDAPAGARLEAQAEQYERSAHLQGQARTYGARAERQHAARPNPIEAGNRAVAESLERSAKLEGQARTQSAKLEGQARTQSAKLEGQARTHSKADSTDEAPAPADETSDDDFVPGSRHMPMR